MIWHETPLKTVFILGAGATRGAFKSVRIGGKKICAPLNGDFFKIAQSFVNRRGSPGTDRDRYRRIREVFQEEFPTRGRWPINMEEAFSLLYVSKDFPEIYKSGRGPGRQAGTRKEIDDFLTLTFEILGGIEGKLGGRHLYSDLVSRLGPQDTLITLNYDTILDTALVNAGWDPTHGYGLTGGGGKIIWKRAKPKPFDVLKNVALLKLHGSLNWYVHGSVDRLSKVFESKPGRVIISEHPRSNDLSGYVRQIIPPVYGKFFAHPHWQALWRKAHKALLEADALVVVGCSLVDTDFHLTGMLSNAIQRRKSSHYPFTAISTVDKFVIRKKWLRLLRGCFKRNLPYHSFAAFADAHLKN